jgi:hypothetical protein
VAEHRVKLLGREAIAVQVVSALYAELDGYALDPELEAQRVGEVDGRVDEEGAGAPALARELALEDHVIHFLGFDLAEGLGHPEDRLRSVAVDVQLGPRSGARDDDGIAQGLEPGAYDREIQIVAHDQAFRAIAILAFFDALALDGEGRVPAHGLREVRVFGRVVAADVAYAPRGDEVHYPFQYMEETLSPGIDDARPLGRSSVVLARETFASSKAPLSTTRKSSERAANLWAASDQSARRVRIVPSRGLDRAA